MPWIGGVLSGSGGGITAALSLYDIPTQDIDPGGELFPLGAPSSGSQLLDITSPADPVFLDTGALYHVQMRTWLVEAVADDATKVFTAAIVPTGGREAASTRPFVADTNWNPLIETTCEMFLAGTAALEFQVTHTDSEARMFAAEVSIVKLG